MTKVYVATPLGERTAGPEAAIQFVDALRRRGIDAFLIAMRGYRGRGVDSEYARYDFSIAKNIDRPHDSILVIPEVSPIESWKELREVPRERTWLGWFSVNNSPDPRARYFRPGPECCSTFPPGSDPSNSSQPANFRSVNIIDSGSFRMIREARRRHPRSSPSQLMQRGKQTLSMMFTSKLLRDPAISFFAQSYYAQGFVREVLNRYALLITDPIRPVVSSRESGRQRVVAYNYAKSWSLIPEVARLLPDVEFVAIRDMSHDQAMDVLARSTVYLELGHLPGRDRMPREAAYLGTPVVALARGSGYCWQDLPLPTRFRISYRHGWPMEAARALVGVLADPEVAAQEQSGYREWVMGETPRYEQAIDEWVETARL